jgi:DNA replication protein DnaC
MRRIAKVELRILDDWAMSDLTAAQRRDLMEIVDDRHDRGSIILASQLPLSRWHGVIGDPTYADAILDRIVHAASRIELQGDSLRKPARAEAAPSSDVIDQPASQLQETTLN